MKDYDSGIKCHPGKTNVVANALRKKSSSHLAHMRNYHSCMISEFSDLNVQFLSYSSHALICLCGCKIALPDVVKEAQPKD